MTTAVTVIAPFYYPADTPLAVGATASLPDSLADQMVSAGKARYQTPRTSDRTDLTADEVSLIRGVVSAAGITTRAALIAAAEANALTPGAMIRLDDGLLCQALTARYVQPIGPWFVDGRRWSVGAATSAIDLSYTTLPPLAPNAQVEIFHQWKMDGTNVTKRGRIYIDGTLGGGVAGAQAIYTRNYTDTNVQVNQYSRLQNRNDAASQMCLTIGDSAAFGASTSALVELTASTDTSKLLRAMGETSKSGSNVAMAITRSGSTATATAAAHGLATGDYIGATGATQTEYNVDPVQITVVDANTFTYPVTGTPATPATGSPVYQKYVGLALVAFRVDIHQGLGF